jgi:hypothetical protein
MQTISFGCGLQGLGGLVFSAHGASSTAVATEMRSAFVIGNGSKVIEWGKDTPSEIWVR